MPTMIRAHESTTNVTSGRNVRDVARRLAYLDPDADPLIGVISKAATKRRAVKNTKFEWGEKGLYPMWDQVNGAIGSGVTALVVDNASYFRVNDVIKIVRTGELLRVTAVNTGTNTLTVSRGVGSTAAAAISDNDDIRILASAYAEGAAKGSVTSFQETIPFNYTEIMRDPFGMTESQDNTDTYFLDAADLRAEWAVTHKLKKEAAFLFGERNQDSSDTNSPIRYTGGLLYFLADNQLNAGGTLTEAELETWLQDVFEHTGGSGSRLLLASPLIVSTIDLLAAGRLQTVSSDKTYGIAINQWLTSHGTLMIAKHRLLVNGPGGQGYGGYAFAVDPSKLEYCYLQNRDTRLIQNIQDNGDDRWTDEYKSEIGLAVQNSDVHGVLSGVTG